MSEIEAPVFRPAGNAAGPRVHGPNVDTRCVSTCYAQQMSPKNSGMRIRVEKELRDAFMRACRAQELHASDVLRDFMRAFTEQQQQGQADLFVDSKRKQQ